MSSIKTAYGTQNQAITITIASLTNGSARASAAIDNSSNLFIDLLVQIAIKSASSSVSSTGYVNIYAVGSVDGGTTYGESVSGSDVGVTLTAPPNARLIGSLNVVANSTTYKSNPMSVAAAFGGVLPDHVVIIIENKTGATLDATGGNHLTIYQGIYGSVA